MLKILRLIIVICLVSNGAYSGAEVQDPGRPRQPSFEQEGQLFSIRIVRGEPVKIFVVGREEASLDLSQLKLVVRRLRPTPAANLKVTAGANYFTISEKINQSTDLEVQTQIKDKTETFKFKLD